MKNKTQESPDLTGKIAIITGAGRFRGIGRASAIALAKRGATLVVTGTGRSPESFPDDEKQIGWMDIESVAKEIGDLGGVALPMVVDVTNPDAVKSMVGTVLDRFGRVDILVNNAAAPMGADRVPVVEIEDDVFRRVIEVKVMGTYYCTKAVAQALTTQGNGGSIVMISSIAGKRGSANSAAYNAANFAINGFTQALAKELGPFGVNVNAVCPGIIPTARWDAANVERSWQTHMANVPSGRPGTYEEVGELVAYLCSPTASYINGQAINIDGGLVTEH